MKNKYKLLLVFVFMFITGCSTKYNLTIDSNLGIRETATILEDNVVLEIYDANLKLIPEQKFYQYKSFPQFKSYKLRKKLFDSNKTGGIVESKFKNIENFKESILFSEMYNDISVDQYGNIVNIHFIGYNASLFKPTADPLFFMEDIEVNIKFHNVVMESNAQKYDEKTNTYTWILNEDESSGSITFSIDRSQKRYDIIFKDFIHDYLAPILIVSFLVVFASITLLVVYKKNNSINKI